MKIVAVIVAGGSSTRFESKTPKLYSKISGVCILELSINKFISHPMVDGVVVVINRTHERLYKKIAENLDLLPFVVGGETRQQSVSNALKALKSISPDKVLIHDAARPFVSGKIISDVINQLDYHKAVDVGCSVTDTIKQKKGDKLNILDRSQLYYTQTPQGFDYELILKLHKSSKKSYTDDISLCIDAGLDVKVVEGCTSNKKITYIEDLNFNNKII